MNILPIVGYGSSILRATCEQADNNVASQDTVIKLIATMGSLRNCAGLAANQINRNQKIFVAKLQGVLQVVINPVIKKRRQEYHIVEGCMSIPNVSSDGVIRDKILDVEYYDRDFNRVAKKLSGFDAVLFQHEYDHLYGILYTDRLDDKNLELIKHKLAEIEEANRPTYYDMIFPDKEILLFKEK